MSSGGQFRIPELPTTAILNNVADLNFSQPERRNLFLPLAIAGLVLASVAAYVLYSLPRQPSSVAITHTATWQAHTTYKSESIVVGQDKVQDDLYVLATVHIDDHLHIPIFLKDFTATLTTADGETLEANAVEQPELLPLYQTFPALKAISSTPLLRESRVEPGKSAEGMILLHFPGNEAMWNKRQSATLTVAFYHQPPQTISFAKP